MPSLSYLNFDIAFERTDDGYAVRVIQSPAGQAGADFFFPFADLELENYLLKLGQRSSGMRRADSPESAAAKEFGGRLYDAVFDDDVRAALRSSLEEARRQDRGLRLRLRFSDAPELADLPWEYLYNAGINRFLALSQETPLVRYLDLAHPAPPLTVQPPLRVLVVISDPSDFDRLDVEEEWARLQLGLEDLTRAGLLELTRLDRATLLELQRQLRQTDYHILHFIGHGTFDESSGDGFLVLEDENGRGRTVSGQYIGQLLVDARSLRLVVINACEGARTSRTDPFAGVAQSLVQQGVPAVVAMQFPISDMGATHFSHEFYLALSEGYPVEGALAEARRAIFAFDPNPEWGVPVLFSRTPEGRLFDVQGAPVPTPAAKIDPSLIQEELLEPLPVEEMDGPAEAPATTPPPAAESPEPDGAADRSDDASDEITSNDLRMVLIIGGTILGAFVTIAILFFAIFRDTSQGTPPQVTPPEIVRFEAEPDEIVAGQDASVRLRWEISGDVTAVEIDGQRAAGGVPFTRTGELLVAPASSAVFALTAYNQGLESTERVFVSVVDPTATPDPAGGATPAPEASAYDITVTFTSIEIIDDCDGPLTGMGEFWLEAQVNGAELRWPPTGTFEVNSGETYAIGESVEVQLSPEDTLLILATGKENDEAQNETMGNVRVERSKLNDWGVGAGSQTPANSECPFTLHYEISAVPVP